MSLPTDNAVFDALAPKAPGQLITSADWNSFVTAAKSVQTTLNAISQAAEARLAAVESGVEKLAADLQGAVSRLAAIEGVLRQNNRVTMQTTQQIYVLGETAVLQTTVTDFAGQPITFTAQSRPWVTFVTTWGRLRAAPGFETDGGVGDRTVTVRTNLQGVAQVRLQPDHAEGFALDFEDDVATSMTSRIAINNTSVAEVMRTAATPTAAKDAGAFRMLALEYDRADATHVRDYVDTYYHKFPERVSGIGLPDVRQAWRDYRSTVLCFVQDDNDPHSASLSRGSGSIQIAFRDWIRPWFHLEYAFDTSALLATYRDRLTPKFTLDLAESVNLVRQEVNSIVADKGALRKQRDYGVIRDALDQMNIAKPPSFLNAVSRSVQNAISLQQTLGIVQTRAVSAPRQEVAFDVMTEAATKADTTVASATNAVQAVQSQLAAMQQSVADAQAKMASLNTNVATVGTRLDAALAESGAVGSLRVQFNTLKTQVGTFSALNPSDIQAKIGTLTDLKDRVFQLETRK